MCPHRTLVGTSVWAPWQTLTAPLQHAASLPWEEGLQTRLDNVGRPLAGRTLGGGSPSRMCVSKPRQQGAEHRSCPARGGFEDPMPCQRSPALKATFCLVPFM